MDIKFTKRLEQYLESECDDYDMSYSWEWCEDTQNCEVEIKRNDLVKHLNFRYDSKKDDLSIELCEDSFYTTREFDYSVKYFWMLISPTLFPDV